MPSGRSPPPGFGIITRRTGWGWYVLVRQFRLDAVQPVLQPCCLDRREVHAIDAWCTLVGACQVVSMAQYIRAVDLVVEQVEPEVRLRLRLEIELSLKRPDLIGCCQAHHQSPILGFFESAPEVRVLSSAGVTRPQQYYDPVRHPPSRRPTTMLRPLPSRRDGSPPITRLTLPTCRAHYPGGPERVQLSVASPSHAAFPVIQAGRRPHLHFRGLLRLHSRYGPPDCSTAQGGLCHEASAQPVAPPSRSSATGPYRQLSGWYLPPLVFRAVGAH